MKLRWLVTLGAMAALTVVSGYAQTGPTVRVSVPFEFTINNTVLPAGEYSISNTGLENLGVLAMRSGDRQHVVLFTGSAAARSNALDQSTLVFNRYGNSYFLTDIWWAGYTSGVELLKSRTEKEAAQTASLRRPERVVLMASR